MRSRKTAVDVARSVRTLDPDVWRRLELAAFRGRHAIRHRLDPDARLRPRALRERVPPMLVGVVMIGAMLAPAVGMALLVPARISAAADTDVAAMLPASALCFLSWDVIAAVLLAEAVRGRRGARFLQGFGLFAIVMAGIALATVWADGRAWSAWLVPIVASVVLGLAMIALTLVLGTGSGVRGERPDDDAAEADWLRYWTAAFDERSRQRVRAELAAAIDDLERRGIVTAAAADRARSAELGLLSLEMERHG